MISYTYEATFCRTTPAHATATVKTHLAVVAAHLELGPGPVPGPGLLGEADAGQDSLEVALEVQRPLVEGGHGHHGLVPHGAALLGPGGSQALGLWSLSGNTENL